MLNNRAVLEAFDVPADLVDDVEIPVLIGMQRQGDVLVVPQRRGVSNGQPVPPDGIAVVRGEAGGNTHLLVNVAPDAGVVTWRPIETRSAQDLGEIVVPEGGTAGLLHPEHGATLIGPGSYVARRQREQADEIRLVAD